MYTTVLALHNLGRWLVLIAAVVAVVRAVRGWQGGRDWTAMDERTGLILTIILDIQLLLGLLLYFVLSPLTTAAFSNFGAAMKDSTVSFFLVEHFPPMVLAIILAHIGRARSRKKAEAGDKHKQAAIFYGIGLLLILVAIPWWRPLLPF